MHYSAIPQTQLFDAKALQSLNVERKVIETGTAADIANAIVEENVLEWTKKDKRRMLHVVYRVGNLDKTIKYESFCRKKYLVFHCAWLQLVIN